MDPAAPLSEQEVIGELLSLGVFDHLVHECLVVLSGEAVALDCIHLEHVHHPGLVVGQGGGDLELAFVIRPAQILRK